ncbi:MAG: glycine zipper family protein [Acetobacteraceae bacterium]
MKRSILTFGFLAVAGLSACAPVMPAGPTVMALPPAGKDAATFQQDDAVCRITASQATGGESPATAANNAAVGSAALGTALGAGVGAALGSLSGAAGTGAAIGGATGLVMGSAIGANNAAYAGASVQQRYDAIYSQCMYARGNAVQAPPTNYGMAPVPYPYPYPYPYPAVSGYVAVPPPVYFGPSVTIGGGWGWRGYPGPYRGWGYRRW